MAQAPKFETFSSPGGFIEQRYIGVQTPDSVSAAISELVKQAKKLNARNKPVLILVDVSEVPKIDTSSKMSEARKDAVQAMTSSKYKRIAVYGNVSVQVLVNTLALIAGKRRKIRVFPNRVDALRWLKDGT